MANPLRISAKVEIDASGAKKGAAETNAAISTVGTTADQAAAKLDELGRASQEGLRTPLGGAGGSGSGSGAGADLDRLRAKFNPLFAVITQYKAVQAEIRQAHAMGAISADEMTEALQRQRQAALASIDAIKGRNTALSQAPKAANQNFQTANLAFQVQDTITTAPFMPWYTVMLQQGPQVASVMDSLDNKAAGLKAAFLSLVSPWSLISMAAVGATAFAVQYFTKASDSANTATEILARHGEAISDLRLRYGEAASGIREFALEGQVVAEADLQDRLKSAYETVKETASEIASFSAATLTSFAPLFKDMDYSLTRQVQSAFNDLRQSIAEGKPDLLAFRAALSDIQSNEAFPQAIRDWAKETKVLDDETLKLARSIPSMNAQLDLIGGSAAAQVAGVSQLSKALQELRSIGVPALSDSEKAYEAYQRAMAADPNSRSAQIAYDAALERLSNQNPTVINSDGNQTSVPLPGSKPITLGDAPSKAEKSAATAAQRAADAYRDLKKSAQDRIEQMQLEAQVSGLTGIAADTLRFKQELLQATGDKGRKATPEQRAEIEKLGKAYEEAATKAAKLQLQSNLQFDREQLGRSTFDQQIANGLRSAGLAIDFDSYEAGLIRTNLQLQYARELVGDINSTFWSGIEQGKGLWESFGDAGVAALKKIADTLMNDVLNSIFSVQSAGSSSGGLFSSLLGGFGSLFGGSSSTPAASWASSGSFDTSSGFSLGGWTGPGSKHQPAGVVHADEFVFSKAATRAIGVGNLYAMHDAALSGRGLAEGGILNVAPLFSASQNAAASSPVAGGTVTLALKLGLSVDETGNIMPVVRQAIAQDAPGIAVKVVEDFSTGTLPDRMAEINDNPRWRG